MIGTNKLYAIGDDTWLRFLKIFIVAGMITGMVMTTHLWVGERLLPLLPVMKVYLPQWVNVFVVVVFFVAMLITCLSRRKGGPIVVIIFGVVLIFLDQLRLQPWVYLYLLLLIPFAVGVDDRAGISRFFLIIIAGVYFWSGIHKLNEHFLDGIYAANLKFILGYSVKNNSGIFRALGYGIGLAEAAIGIGLLFNLTRRVAVFAAILMHFLIITLVLFQDAVGDSIVIPWNITMIALNLVTFYPLRSPFLNLTFLGVRSGILTGFLIILVWICPAFNFVGRWDYFLAFSLYSNKISMFYVAIHQDEVDKIDQRLIKYFVTVPGLVGGELIDVHWWSEDELNVPFYPEKRAFIGLSSYFCGLGIPEDRIVFLELARGDSKESVINSFRCTSLGQ